MARVSGSFGSAFNADQFKTAIKNAMKMGLPETTAMRPTFKWTPVRNFTNADSGGTAWTRDSTIISTNSHADVQIDCAVEFVTARGQLDGQPMGEFNTPQAIITVLDTDYALVEGADEVLLGENTYKINYVTPVGLFDVTVFSIHCTAMDEN